MRIATFEESPLSDRAWVIDALLSVEGCVSAYHVEDPDTGRGVSISFFTDADAAEAGTRAVAERRQQLGLDPRGPDRVERYEVLHGF